MSTKLESPIVKQPPSAWHAVPADEIAASFDTDLALGLSSKQATQRLAKFGANELGQTAESSWVAVLARQFWDALTLILVVATALSVVVGDLIDAATIGAIIILNGLLGFVQEWKAEKALAALHRMLHPQCTVIRDGSEQVIARRLLVPGDLVQLETGDEVESKLTLLGVVGMLDPPRLEVPEAVRVARQAGIKIIMITGDAAATALAIGKSVGLADSSAVTGNELDAMTDEKLASQLQQDVIFARTTPEHKLRIVQALQSQGHIVGMTGDGVNDAPALKQADIGIAMGLRGTDVAKGAADMVLTDDNFSSIVGAIEEGRRQYDNIQKFVRYLLSSNTGMC